MGVSLALISVSEGWRNNLLIVCRGDVTPMPFSEAARQRRGKNTHCRHRTVKWPPSLSQSGDVETLCGRHADELPWTRRRGGGERGGGTGEEQERRRRRG